MIYSKLKRSYFTVEILTWFAVALPLPLMTLYMQSRGLNLLNVGLVSALFSLAVVIFELPTGGLADTWGRKRVALTSQAVMLLASLAFLLAFGIWGFTVGWILMGLGRALSSGALRAWYVDELLRLEPDLDLQPHLAQAGTVSILGLSLGTLLGGLVPQVFSFLGETGVFTALSSIIAASFALRLLALLALALLIKEERPTATDQETGVTSLGRSLGEALDLARSSSIVPLIFAGGFAASLALSSVETFWQPHLASWLGAENNSYVFGGVMAITFFMGMVGNLASIPINKRLGSRHGYLAAAATVLGAIFIILLALAPSPLLAALAFWGYYFTLGLVDSPVQTLLNNETATSSRSSVLSLSSLVGYAGAFLGSITLGYVAETHSIPAAFLLTAGVLGVSFLAYLRAERVRTRAVRARRMS